MVWFSFQSLLLVTQAQHRRGRLINQRWWHTERLQPGGCTGLQSVICTQRMSLYRGSPWEFSAEEIKVQRCDVIRDSRGTHQLIAESRAEPCNNNVCTPETVALHGQWPAGRLSSEWHRSIFLWLPLAAVWSRDGTGEGTLSGDSSLAENPLYLLCHAYLWSL